MTDETQYRTPGQLIQDLLTERGWTQRVLAIVLGADESTLNKIINGKRPLDAKMALAFSELFGVPAERFLNLQLSFDLAHARLVARPDPGRRNRAHLFGQLPVMEMIKRGWIDVEDIRKAPKVEAALAKFLNTDSPDQIEILAHAAKKTNVAGEATPVQLAWLYRVKEIASERLVARYSPDKVKTAVQQLRPLLASPEAARKAPRILAESGIRFVIVEALSGSKIDGVCFWPNESAPVIGMSMRYDRIDNFWFVLRHEIEHVIQLHGRAAVMLDAELEGERAGVGPNIPEEERQANEAAAEFCVPQRKMDGFIARKAPLCAERDIVGFARTLQVHPGLVAGQLQRRTNRYDRFRNHLVKMRAIVTPSAMVDGWGDVASVGT
jgi:HTH-type transcriptional regulator / antitoxin HigA